MILGGQVGIGEHARIEEGVMLGGQGWRAAATRFCAEGRGLLGNAGAPVREYLKQLAALARMARK